MYSFVDALLDFGFDSIEYRLACNVKNTWDDVNDIAHVNDIVLIILDPTLYVVAISTSERLEQ
jgi:hypothetical protein